MRNTTIKGNDGLIIDLGSNTDIIEEVMKIGKAVDYLIYKVEMTGFEVVQFMKKYHLDRLISQDIILENTYTITSYDW